MQSIFSFSLGPTSLCSDAPSLKKEVERETFLKSGGLLYTGSYPKPGYWKWLLPTKCENNVL